MAKKTVNLSYSAVPFGWRGPYVQQETLDRVVEHLREGCNVQITIDLSGARGPMDSHVSKVQEAWILSIDPYDVPAEIGRTKVVEAERRIILTINIHPDYVGDNEGDRGAT